MRNIYFRFYQYARDTLNDEGSYQEDDMKTLYVGGDIVPMTGKDDRVEALLVGDDGTIVHAGSEHDARALASDAPVVDLRGKTLLPGFIDPHSHILSATTYVLTADLSDARSFADIQKTLRDFISERGLGANDVVQANSYDHNLLAEQRHPDRHVLDEVTTEIPIIITHMSGHVGSANTLTYSLAGIDASTPNPDGGKWLREEDGTPLGPWEEPAALGPLNEKVVGPRSHVDFPSLADEVQRYYTRYGVTTCQDGATLTSLADDAVACAEQGRWTMDVVSYPITLFDSDRNATIAAHSNYVSRDYRGHFRFGGIKIILDGSPQGRTAWMSEPYEVVTEDDDPSYRGYPQWENDDLVADLKDAIDRGYQVLAHCNGDAAAEQYLNCYEQALAQSSRADKMELRPVMIHCQTARSDQLKRMVNLRMIPSIFAGHTYYWGDVHLKNFGQQRGMRVAPVGEAHQLGLPFNLHTDTPIIPCDMLFTVWCAVNRVTRDGVQLAVDQKVSVFDALRGITINAAYQYFEEDRKGTLEKGKLADLVILDRNPLTVDPMEIKDIRVLATIKEGETIWEASS
ncbi:MAG: amidohydrolase [Actinomycetaceae bacterium]|nr:amidohydrolase [Actinomycetaceae bacterium]